MMDSSNPRYVAARAAAEQEFAHSSRSLDTALSLYQSERNRGLPAVEAKAQVAAMIVRSAAGASHDKAVGHIAAVVANACARLVDN